MKNKNNLIAPTVIAEDAEQQSLLSAAEKKELADCERNFAQGNVKAALALKTIRDKRLYRQEYRRWEDYITDRWEMSRGYSFQLIFFAEMHTLISATRMSANGGFLPTPTGERQVRSLSNLGDDEKRLEAWTSATERNRGKCPSGTLVETVVSEMLDAERQAQSPAVADGALAETSDAVLHSSDGDTSVAVTETPGALACALTARIYDVPMPEEDASVLPMTGGPNAPQTPTVTESSKTHQVQRSHEAPPASPVLTLVSTEPSKVVSNLSQADELAAACRQVVSDAVDETIANRVYEAVRDIVAEALRQQAA